MGREIQRSRYSKDIGKKSCQTRKYVSRTITQEVQLLCEGSQLDNVTQEQEQYFVNAVKH